MMKSTPSVASSGDLAEFETEWNQIGYLFLDGVKPPNLVTCLHQQSGNRRSHQSQDQQRKIFLISFTTVFPPVSVLFWQLQQYARRSKEPFDSFPPPSPPDEMFTDPELQKPESESLSFSHEGSASPEEPYSYVNATVLISEKHLLSIKK